MRAGASIHVTGVVQGVGFRPFIHRLASSLGLAGWVQNSPSGVLVEVEGERDDIREFSERLRREAPPLALIQQVELRYHEPQGLESFSVRKSSAGEETLVLVPPDVATCAACLREILDPGDRRFRYPFTNCTDCGPRFTIIESLPYDRERTSMHEFRMCSTCLEEYRSIESRRYHAQPNACPRCGPGLRFLDEQTPGTEKDPVKRAAGLLARGEVVGIKGLGGFHLACDATNEQAVRKIRLAKSREAKPFAIMCRDIETVSQVSYLTEEERQVLESPARPIVLLRRKPDSPVSSLVAPGNRFLGIMLPYTPLHRLLLSESPASLVMTSGNLSSEPLVRDDEEARMKLRGATSSILTHNRRIVTRCDDSVVKLLDGKLQILRRARGYAPLPVQMPLEGPSVLACGAQSKNTFTLTRGRLAFVSQHIGDVENAETYEWFQEEVARLKSLLGIAPQVVACDMHPGYLTTEFASTQTHVQLTRVQHHHAHVASCMAEKGLEGEVLGVSFDGTGYGTDGTLWGGEFIAAGYDGFRRLAHLRPVPMPGGEMAVREPYRMAATYLADTFGPGWWHSGFKHLPPWPREKLSTLEEMITRRLNSPLTSSCGRLFDAVASILGLRDEVTYEGQAAVELETIAATEDHGSYECDIDESSEPFTLDFRPAIRRIVEDLGADVSREVIAARFHSTVTNFTVGMCKLLRSKTGLDRVVLSGGVFQNGLLSLRVGHELESAGFRVYQHEMVPPNDGGISLGQAVAALATGGSHER